MKKILIGVLLLALPCLMGCEKQRFHYTAVFDSTYPLPVDAPNGVIAVETYISPGAVRDLLDLPSDATIEAVEIEDLSIRAVVLPGNVASAVSVSGSLHDLDGRGQVWNNQIIPLVGVNVPYIGLNALLEEGVAKLRSKLKAYVEQLSTFDAMLKLEGNSSPTAGQRINARIDVKIRATVKYWRCLRVPREVFNGQSCDKVTGD